MGTKYFHFLLSLSVILNISFILSTEITKEIVQNSEMPQLLPPEPTNLESDKSLSPIEDEISQDKVTKEDAKNYEKERNIVKLEEIEETKNTTISVEKVSINDANPNSVTSNNNILSNDNLNTLSPDSTIITDNKNVENDKVNKLPGDPNTVKKQTVSNDVKADRNDSQTIQNETKTLITENRPVSNETKLSFSRTKNVNILSDNQTVDSNDNSAKNLNKTLQSENIIVPLYDKSEENNKTNFNSNEQSKTSNSLSNSSESVESNETLPLKDNLNVVYLNSSSGDKKSFMEDNKYMNTTIKKDETLNITINNNITTNSSTKSSKITNSSYTLPKNSNLSESERERLEKKLDSYIDKLKDAKKNAKHKLKMKLEKAHERINQAYKSLKHKYENNEDNLEKFNSKLDHQKQKIERAYIKAVKRIRKSFLKALDKFASKHGFEKQSVDAKLFKDEEKFQSKLNRTCDHEISELKHMKEKELEHLDKLANHSLHRMNLTINSTTHNESIVTNNILIKLNASTVKLNSSTSEKKEIYYKIHKGNFKIVVYITVFLLFISLVGILLSMNKKKKKIEEINHLNDDDLYHLIR